MKVYSEVTLMSFDAWSGAVSRKREIMDAGKGEEFDALIEECYPDGLSETDLNDILWFEEDWWCEALGMEEEEDEEE